MMRGSGIRERLKAGDAALVSAVEGVYAQRQVKADAALSQLRESLQHLGIQRSPSLRLRVAYRRWHWATPPARVWQTAAVLLCIGSLPPALVHHPLNAIRPDESIPYTFAFRDLKQSLDNVSQLPKPFFGFFALLAAVIYLPLIISLALGAILPVFTTGLFLLAIFRTSHPAVMTAFTAVTIKRRYDLPVCVLHAVRACGDARKASVESRPLRLRFVASNVNEVSKAIRRAYRTRGTLAAFSHRRRLMKKHAGVVVAALRAAEARLDSDPNQALHDLGVLILKIAERYVDGRIGQLLDEDELADLQPAPDREPLRLILSAVLFGAGATGIVLAPVPEAAQTYLVGACGLLVLSLIYGRGASKALGLLAALRGG
ncbi:hypothetical protein BX257_6642 [Streptomyces sp. 3212.3]|nr:hypothetical protein BX257_6642 [Streptomyces sp. 3212.3]